MAFWTASIASVRMVLIASWSRLARHRGESYQRTSSSTFTRGVHRYHPRCDGSRPHEPSPSDAAPRPRAWATSCSMSCCGRPRPSRAGPTCPAGSRSARAARRPTSPAGWRGSGSRSQLVCAVGRDGAGRSLVAQLQRDGVNVRAIRVAGHRTGRIGVLVAPSGERSFVADRRAATHMEPEGPQGRVVRQRGPHPPAGVLAARRAARVSAGIRAVELARARGARGARVSVDLASVGPLLAHGRREARELVARLQPDLVFATEPEAEALLGRHAPEGLLERRPGRRDQAGPRGARVFARDERAAAGEPLRFDVATSADRTPRTRPAPATRSTPGSSPAGSARSEAATPARTRCIARRWPATGPRPATSRSPRTELPPG